MAWIETEDCYVNPNNVVTAEVVYDTTSKMYVVELECVDGATYYSNPFTTELGATAWMIDNSIIASPET
jgi:hypothetical protein